MQFEMKSDGGFSCEEGAMLSVHHVQLDLRVPHHVLYCKSFNELHVHLSYIVVLDSYISIYPFILYSSISFINFNFNSIVHYSCIALYVLIIPFAIIVEKKKEEQQEATQLRLVIVKAEQGRREFVFRIEAESTFNEYGLLTYGPCDATSSLY